MPRCSQSYKHSAGSSDSTSRGPSVTNTISAVDASTSSNQQQQQGQQPHPQVEGHSRHSSSSSSSTPSRPPSAQTTTAQQVQQRSASAGASLDGSRRCSGGDSIALASAGGAGRSGGKAGELWRPHSGGADAGRSSSSWGKVVTGAGESMPPKPRGAVGMCGARLRFTERPSIKMGLGRACPPKP
eukprot:1158333-Pelagomonas_calceolata.AAC.5